MKTKYGENGEDGSSYNNYGEEDDNDECCCVEVPCCDHDCDCKICHG